MRYGIFRLIQEPLVNVARHPPATRAGTVPGEGYREERVSSLRVTLGNDSTTTGARLALPLPPERAVP
jgi:hypothetical protein